jgi:hypothetical protein
VQFAYAAGCDHLSLFNISEEGLREIAESIAGGWQSFLPLPWRPVIFREEFQRGEEWRRHFVRAEGVTIEVIWPGPKRALEGAKVGVSARALLRVTSRETIDQAAFERLALRYRARAFVSGRKTAEAYLAVRAGRSPDALQEVDRMVNANARRQVDLTALVRDAPEVYVEFEFHPLGLPGWVCLFEVALEIPWAEETLLATNRSYRADRLRCESAVVGWRAEAVWALRRAERELSRDARATERETLAEARRLLQAGAYRRAYEVARLTIMRHAPTPARIWRPSERREEAGELRAAGADFVSLDPYADGCQGRRFTVAPGASLELEENGARCPLPSPRDLRFGDDVHATLRDGQIVTLLARRGTAAGPISAMRPTTAFALPTLAVHGQPPRKISSLAAVHGRTRPARPATCWLQVGPLPFRMGDRVRIRWNPHTDRIVEVRLEAPAE